MKIWCNQKRWKKETLVVRLIKFIWASDERYDTMMIARWSNRFRIIITWGYIFRQRRSTSTTHTLKKMQFFHKTYQRISCLTCFFYIITLMDTPCAHFSNCFFFSISSPNGFCRHTANQLFSLDMFFFFEKKITLIKANINNFLIKMRENWKKKKEKWCSIKVEWVRLLWLCNEKMKFLRDVVAPAFMVNETEMRMQFN